MLLKLVNPPLIQSKSISRWCRPRFSIVDLHWGVHWSTLKLYDSEPSPELYYNVGELAGKIYQGFKVKFTSYLKRNLESRVFLYFLDISMLIFRPSWLYRVSKMRLCVLENVHGCWKMLQKLFNFCLLLETRAGKKSWRALWRNSTNSWPQWFPVLSQVS